LVWNKRLSAIRTLAQRDVRLREKKGAAIEQAVDCSNEIAG